MGSTIANTEIRIISSCVLLLWVLNSTGYAQEGTFVFPGTWKFWAPR